MNRRFGRMALGALAALLICLAPAAHADASTDGPYVAPAPKGGWVARWSDGEGEDAKARSLAIAPGERLRVESVGAVSAFEVTLRPPAQTAPDAIHLESDAPLFVVADIHGEYDILVELLRNQKIVDARLRWAFGRGQVVFLGDVFDRGAHQLEVLWLIYQLQGEAAAAGGDVEFLLGNHELMALRGDARYLHPRHAATVKALGAKSYADLFDGRSVLGQWLRTRASVLRVGDALFLHGGISPEAVERGFMPARLSRAIREVLAGSADPAQSQFHEFAIRSYGPQWYRGYFSRDGAPPEASADEVDAIRRALGVRAIFVGHTALSQVTPLFDGRVIAVQIYPERDAETGVAVMGAVRREQGRWYRAGVDGSRVPMQVAPRADRT